MILPEDTKAPIPSDDEDYEDDFASLPPSPTHPDQPLPFNPNQYGSHNYDYPSSPNSAITHPLLLFPDEDDIELGPAPPYTPHDPQRRKDRKGELRKNLGKRFVMGVAGAMGLWVGLMGISAIGWGIWGKGHHGRPPSQNPGGEDGQYPGPPGPPFSGGPDGDPVECVEFTSESPWSSFPISEDQPYLPAPLGIAQGSRRSINSTFIVSAQDDNEVFAHLTLGPAAIGNFFVSTYDADSDAVYEEVKLEGSLVDKVDGQSPRKGEYVRITVETIYDMLPDVGDTLVDNANSPGWEMLGSSRVCLMKRSANNGTDTEDDRPPPEKRDGEEERQPPSPRRRSTGVGIYTQHAANSIHGNLTDTAPLQFRFHIAVPSSSATRPQSIVGSLMNALSFPPPPDHGKPPRTFVPSLEISGGSSSVYVDDLSSNVEIREISLDSGFGEIVVQGLKAEEISLKTTGRIDAKVAVSNRLEVDTLIGDIDLDITLATPSPFARQPPQPPAPSPNSTDPDDHPPPHPDGPMDSCDIPPAQVDVRAGNGQTTVRYTGWEQPCRGLNQELISLTGSMKVYAHPLFQGAYTLVTATGPIYVDLGNEDLPDPEGLGRWRNITLAHHDRPGSKHWTGDVKWEDKSEMQPEDSASGQEDGSEEAEDAVGEQGAGRNARPPPPPPHKNRRTDRMMSAKSSIGGIDLIF